MDCPYCNQIHRVGGLFCSRNDDVSKLDHLESGIHTIRTKYLEMPDPHTARLCMHLDLHGGMKFRVNRRDFTLRKGNYLITNQGSELQCSLNDDVEHINICMAFKVGLPEEIFLAYTRSPDRCLDDGGAFNVSKLNFFETTYQVSTELQEKLKWLGFYTADHSMFAREELSDYYASVLESLVVDHCKLQGKLQRFSNVKRSTREELFRRVDSSRSFIHDNYSRNISIKDMADHACLSQFYFQRLFKQVFNITPYHYLSHIRLTKAMELVRSSQFTINQICRIVGFEDTASFIRLFRKTHLITPGRVRKTLPRTALDAAHSSS